jgi:hypothetical protein
LVAAPPRSIHRWEKNPLLFSVLIAALQIHHVVSMSKPNPKTRVVIGGLAVASLLVLGMARGGAFPQPVRVILAGGVLLGWIVFALSHFCGPIGRRGVAAVVLLVAVVGAWVTYEYFADIPRQQYVAEIKQIGDVGVITTGRIWTGDIEYLDFDPHLSEAQVLQILGSPGLEHLERVVFKRTPITDATLERLAQMPSVDDVYIEGSKITDEGVAKLKASLPNCRLETR